MILSLLLIGRFDKWVHPMTTFDRSGLEEYIMVEEFERDGIWLDNFPEGRAFRIKRAADTNRKYVRTFQAAIKPYRRQRGGLTNLDPDVSNRIMRHVYAHTIVVDWRGIEDDQGNDVPCTPDNVEAFFEAFPEIFNDIMALASEASLFSEQALQEASEKLGEG